MAWCIGAGHEGFSVLSPGSFSSRLAGSGPFFLKLISMAVVGKRLLPLFDWKAQKLKVTAGQWGDGPLQLQHMTNECQVFLSLFGFNCTLMRQNRFHWGHFFNQTVGFTFIFFVKSVIHFPANTQVPFCCFSEFRGQI